MTRINTVPVKSLHKMHLLGEYKEITRVFTLTRKAQERGKNKWNYGIPKEYTLGTGHVKFFSSKLQYCLERYHQLVDEMRERGFKPNPISDEDLLSGIDKHWMGSYIPNDIDMKINQDRIDQRLKEMGV